ncbi:peroxisome assembly protein 26 [Fundulus heteroclitus]|uniref:peroxisome assembly protein 26 n=1 Tax=Fundulus heteroclitus TaxID=8078 RepID=UPI00165BDDED|nr:peroxisome assembly protein 26 [Fundulus heteroclitus]
MSSLSDTQARFCRSSGSACSPPPPSSCSSSQPFNVLDSAAELMMVHGDFQAAFDACNAGLEKLGRLEPEDNNRCADLKAGFCMLGVQALAELNQWQGVFSWVLQHYEHQEDVPAKIMQLCILLYSKVGEPAVMQEAARVWLRCPSNVRAAGFRSVAELYLLHVLVPLGYLEEARELVASEVGSVAFTEEQRQTALDVVEEKARQNQEDPTNPEVTSDSEIAAHPASTQGSLLQKLDTMLRCLYRKCPRTGSGSFPLRKVFLAAVLLYMLLFRMDPAFPSSYMWISKLLKLIKRMWRAMFAPHYQPLT